MHVNYSIWELEAEYLRNEPLIMILPKASTHLNPALFIYIAPLPPTSLHSFRRLHTIDVGSFLTDIPVVHPHHLLYEWQTVPSSMLPLVSGINSRLPSFNHALISSILHHPVFWVALEAEYLRNDFISSIDSPLSSSITPSLFHSRLKTSLFCKSFPP